MCIARHLLGSATLNTRILSARENTRRVGKVPTVSKTPLRTSTADESNVSDSSANTELALFPVGEKEQSVAQPGRDDSENLAENNPAHAYLGWWVQLGIGGYCMRGLHDTGAARTVLRPNALQIASACNASIHPYKGPGT